MMEVFHKACLNPDILSEYHFPHYLSSLKVNSGANLPWMWRKSSSPTIMAGDRLMLRWQQNESNWWRTVDMNLIWIDWLKSLRFLEQSLWLESISIKVCASSIRMFSSLVFLLFVKGQGLVLFYYLIINKSHEKTKNNKFILLTILSVLPKPDTATEGADILLHNNKHNQCIIFIYSDTLLLMVRISYTESIHYKICKFIFFLLSSRVPCYMQLRDPVAAGVVQIASTWSSWGTVIVSQTLANSGCAHRFPFQTGVDTELFNTLSLLSAPSGPHFNHTGLKIGSPVMSWLCSEWASSKAA